MGFMLCFCRLSVLGWLACVRWFLALPCLALPCLALPCLALPCLALPCLALPCLALPCLALPCLALPCLALPCLALPRLALPCLALPCLASPYLALSCAVPCRAVYPYLVRDTSERSCGVVFVAVSLKNGKSGRVDLSWKSEQQRKCRSIISSSASC